MRGLIFFESVAFGAAVTTLLATTVLTFCCCEEGGTAAVACCEAEGRAIVASALIVPLTVPSAGAVWERVYIRCLLACCKRVRFSNLSRVHAGTGHASSLIIPLPADMPLQFFFPSRLNF